MFHCIISASSYPHIETSYRKFFLLIFLKRTKLNKMILTKVCNISKTYLFVNDVHTNILMFCCGQFNVWYSIAIHKTVVVWEQVYVHVYKLKNSELGFYHTGIELHGVEFTYCENRGIARHRPRRCDWGQFLGSIRLGEVGRVLQM